MDVEEFTPLTFAGTARSTTTAGPKTLPNGGDARRELTARGRFEP
ncbi:MAG: hypothetical protein QOJ71_89, partial [Actinomycetota bacterium]|nr:hypothetical protein [Actinomycetota bacterium]